MNNRNVRIISISGMPLSGKSTAIKKIKTRLLSEGILENNIHIVKTGNMFREYFKKIMLIVSNIDNEEILEELSKDKSLQRIFSSKEYRSRMKNAILDLKSKGYKTENFDIETANNDVELKDIRDMIDDIIDGDIKLLGEDILNRNNPDEFWLIDSRLAFMNIPKSFAVRLIVDKKIAAQRLMSDKDKRGSEDNKYETIEKAEEKVNKRTYAEIRRFKEKYGIDLANRNNYDLIIDTSHTKVDDVVDTILKCEEKFREGKNYSSNHDEHDEK